MKITQVYEDFPAICRERGGGVNVGAVRMHRYREQNVQDRFFLAFCKQHGTVWFFMNVSSNHSFIRLGQKVYVRCDEREPISYYGGRILNQDFQLTLSLQRACFLANWFDDKGMKDLACNSLLDTVSEYEHGMVEHGTVNVIDVPQPEGIASALDETATSAINRFYSR